MNLDQVLLFFFSALGAFNGLILGLYFLFSKKPRHISSYFLGLFFISLSVRIGKSVFYYFNSNLALEYLQLGLSFCLLIGPSLYFYFKSLPSTRSTNSGAWKYHFGILVPLILILGLYYPYSENPLIWNRYGVRFIYYIWLAYTVMAGSVIREVLIQLFQKGSKLRLRDRWVASIFIGNTAILAAYLTVGITSYILGALLFSFMLYGVITVLFSSKKDESILVRDEAKKIDPEQTADDLALHRRIIELIEKDELFRNPNLKLVDIASKLHVLPHAISKTVNQVEGKSFPQFLNILRIERAKQLILENKNHTLEAIGYDSGFNSKSTFYATFKKITGQTPSNFKEMSASAA